MSAFAISRAMNTISPMTGGHAFALKLLDHVRARMVQFQEETGHMYNLEGNAGREGTTYRFAKEDRKRFPRYYSGRYGIESLLHE